MKLTLIAATLVIKQQNFEVSSKFIDISPLLSVSSSAQDIKKCCKLIDSELVQNGYFITSYENISSLLNPYVFDAADDLFSLDHETKSKYSIRTLKSAGRGYLPFGSETGVSSYYEIKEGFSYGYPSSVYANNENSKDSSQQQQQEQHPLQQRNIWPDTVKPESVKHLEQLFNFKSVLANTLLHSLKIAIQDEQDEVIKSKQYNQESFNQNQLNPSFLDSELPGGEYISLMRVFHYFTKLTSSGYREGTEQTDLHLENKTLTGSSPHTDWGLLTVITYNGVDGLEFFDRQSNSWKALDHIENGIVINAGDYLKLLSGGRYHSPVHRVMLSKSERNRMSFVFFFYPRYDSIIPQMMHSHSHESHDQMPATSATGAIKMISTCTEDDDKVCPDMDSMKETNKRTDHFESFEYNTLLKDKNEDLAKLSKQNDVIFGDYIIAKWQGVYSSNRD